MQDVQKQVGGSIVGLADMLTGGALQQCAVFALGVMPYISASIIMMRLLPAELQCMHDVAGQRAIMMIEG